jgi:hypothetical protein
MSQETDFVGKDHVILSIDWPVSTQETIQMHRDVRPIAGEILAPTAFRRIRQNGRFRPEMLEKPRLFNKLWP